MQKFIAIGNLASDPDLRKTKGDVSVCSFRLAVQRDFKNDAGVREADFFNIVAWRGLADLCARSLHKGSKIGLIGKLQNRSYDAQDGSKRFVTEVIMEELEFLTPRGEGAQRPVAGVTEGATGVTDGNAHSVDGSDFSEVMDDELPF